ncbi:ssDNA-binding protein [Marinobacter sp. DS40M6]|uniref:ssDNA-binding protein n=1 Tax=Marinobacter sp. DS40M6 TaxID=1597776 RepID=UPI0023592843|nr:ssDNA-binding protein [Marinobacter sp. DS40M6]MDC8457839.1 DUF2815 family protein [Marinobacter sp. DS40M6]
MAQKKSISGEKIQLKRVRLSFPTLHKADVPKGYDNAEPKFSANFLLDPKDPGHKALLKHIKAEMSGLIKKAWPAGKPPKFKPIDCFGKGEGFTNNTTKQPYEGYEGMYVVAANNKKRPTLIDRDKTPLTPDEVEQRMYAGCYVDAFINFWIQDNQFGEAIRCSLQAVRFREDGEEFGAGGVDPDEFDDLDDGELADELDDDDDLDDLDDLDDDDMDDLDDLDDLDD